MDLGKNSTEVNCHCPCITTPTWLITDDVNLNLVVKVLCARFLCWQVTGLFFFPFHTLKASYFVQPIPKGQGLKLHLLEQECLSILFAISYKKDLSHIPNFFIYSIIYLKQCGLMDIYFISWIINQYSILLLKFSRFGPWEFFGVNSCVFLTYSHPFWFLTILRKHNKWQRTQECVIYDLNTLASSGNLMYVDGYL